MRKIQSDSCECLYGALDFVMRRRRKTIVDTDEPDGGEVAEDVHLPVDGRSGRHLVQEEHDQNQHGDVAQHQRQVDEPRALALALAVALLREEVHDGSR